MDFSMFSARYAGEQQRGTERQRERELSGPRELPNWPDKSWAATTRCALPLAALPQLLRPLLAPADSLNLLTNLAVFALASNRYC